MAKNRLPALDGLRGLAALSVVTYHSFLRSPDFSQGIATFQTDGSIAWWATLSPLRLLWDGKAAVWLFFVLSGYVLSRRYWSGAQTSTGAYYVRRFLRLYLPVVGSAAVAVLVFTLSRVLLGDVTHWLPAGTSLAHLLHNLVLVDLSNAPVNGVWWSLRWEVWFSLLLPPLSVALRLLGCKPSRRLTSSPALFGVLCAALVIAQPWVRLTYDTGPLWNQVQLYLPVFGVGIAIAAYEPRLRAAAERAAGLRGWLALVAVVVVLSARAPVGALDTVDTMEHRWALCLQNASVLLGMSGLLVLALSWNVAGTALARRPVMWLGTRSYSLYLVHLPIVHAVATVGRLDDCPVWYPVTVIGLSLGATAAFYRFVEAPSMRLAQRVGRAPKRPAPDGAQRSVNSEAQSAAWAAVTSPTFMRKVDSATAEAISRHSG